MDDGGDEKNNTEATMPFKIDLKPPLTCADLEDDEQQINDPEDNCQGLAECGHFISSRVFYCC